MGARVSGRPNGGHGATYARDDEGWIATCACAWTCRARRREDTRDAHREHRRTAPRRCRRCGTGDDLIPPEKGSGNVCRGCAHARTREWAELNPEAYELRRREHQLRRYGITPAEYDRLLEEQAGRCRVCAAEPDGVLDVDHDHDTGAVRGLLCRRCNRGIGLWKDDPELLRRAADYLTGARV